MFRHLGATSGEHAAPLAYPDPAPDGLPSVARTPNSPLRASAPPWNLFRAIASESRVSVARWIAQPFTGRLAWFPRLNGGTGVVDHGQPGKLAVGEQQSFGGARRLTLRRIPDPWDTGTERG